jgi:hypothetical protein
MRRLPLSSHLPPATGMLRPLSLLLHLAGTSPAGQVCVCVEGACLFSNGQLQQHERAA